MVKILITTIQVNFGAAWPWHKIHLNRPLLKFLPLTYHHSHFLVATLDFTSFHHSLFEGYTLFLQLGCFGLDFTSFCICIPQSRLWGFLNLSFFFTTGRRKDEADVKYFKYF